MPCSYFMQVRINIPPKKEKFRGLRIRYGVIFSVANKVFILVLYKLNVSIMKFKGQTQFMAKNYELIQSYGILASAKIRFIKMA